MNGILTIIGLTLMAGLAIPVGAALACVERIHRRWLEDELRHSIIAFGGGALLSAIALVLVPEGSRDLNMTAVTICFAAGGLTFLGLDILLSKLQGSFSQSVAMLSDFVPEAMALGAAFVHEPQTAGLLAGLIALQNLPEGFNSYRELASRPDFRLRQIFGIYGVMAFLGPAAGMVGYFWLTDFPQLVAGIMLFAAGGIMYLIFEDIAPQVKLEYHWAPPLGAVAGFLLGLVGQLWVNS